MMRPTKYGQKSLIIKEMEKEDSHLNMFNAFTYAQTVHPSVQFVQMSIWSLPLDN